MAAMEGKQELVRLAVFVAGLVALFALGSAFQLLALVNG